MHFLLCIAWRRLYAASLVQTGSFHNAFCQLLRYDLKHIAASYFYLQNLQIQIICLSLPLQLASATTLTEGPWKCKRHHH